MLSRAGPPIYALSYPSPKQKPDLDVTHATIVGMILAFGIQTHTVMIAYAVAASLAAYWLRLQATR